MQILGVKTLPLTVKMEETEGDSSINTSLVNNHQLEDICDNHEDLIDDNDLPVIDQLEDITDSQVINVLIIHCFISILRFVCVG